MFYVIQCINSEPPSWGVVTQHKKREEAEAAALELAKDMPGTFCVAEGVCRVLKEVKLEVVR